VSLERSSAAREPPRSVARGQGARPAALIQPRAPVGRLATLLPPVSPSFPLGAGPRSLHTRPEAEPCGPVALPPWLPRAPVKTGELKGMKESNSEGVAIHAGPEPCVVVRKGGGEASAGVRAGRVLSREIRDPQRELRKLRGADALGEGGRQHRARRYSKARPALARSIRPRARTESTRTGTGRSRRWLSEMGPAARIVKPKGERR
jgi:hypothetical protein